MDSVEPRVFQAAQVLRVLLLEDRDDDALLVEHALRRTGFPYALKRARREAEFEQHLEPGLDLVLADYHVPGFGALRALEALQKRGLDVPLVVVSGDITEAEAAEAVRRGAADCVRKDALGRLGTAITAALEQGALRAEMREARAALARTENEFRAAFEHSPTGIAFTALDGRWLRVNGALCEMLGYGERELLATSWRRLVHPEDLPTESAALARLVAGEIDCSRSELRYLHRDGRTVWVGATGSLVRDSDGAPLYRVLQLADITERKRAEQRLARLDRARRVMAEVNRVLVHADAESELFEKICRVAVELGGYRQAWIGLVTSDAARPVVAAAHAGYGADAPMRAAATWTADGRYRGIAAEAALRGETCIVRDILHDIRHASVRERARSLGYQSSIALPLAVEGRTLAVLVLHAAEPEAFDSEEIALLEELAADAAFGLGALRLRAARDQAERRSRYNEQRFADTFNQAAVGIVHVDLQNRYLLVNRKFCELVGYAEEELIGNPASMLSHPEEIGIGEPLRAKLLAGEIASFSQEKRYRRKDGRYIWVNRTESVARDGAGRPLYFLRVIEDITGRKELERRFELTFERAGVGMTQVALDGRFLYVNAKFSEIVGYSRAELLGMRTEDLTHPEDRAATQALRARILSGEVDSAASEKRLVCKDGSVIWVNRTFSVARAVAGEPLYFIAVIEDITERKRAEAELRRQTEIAQLLESLARAANEAASPEAAMQICVQRICEHGSWRLGRLGLYGARCDGRCPERSVWYPQDVSAYEALVRASDDPAFFAAGGRFISVVLNEKRPVWVSDIAPDRGFGRLSVARACGLRSAFAFPVIVAGEVCAFLEFFAEEPRAPDARLLEAVTSVAAQLARLVERSRALAAAGHLAAIVESSTDAIVSVGPDGTILTWNPGAEKLFGYRAAEAVGRNIAMLTPEDLAREVGTRRARVFAGETVEPQDTERVTREGRRVRVSITASPVRDASGRVVAEALVYRDVSERYRAEEAVRSERALLHAIIDTVPEYIYVKDLEGRFVLANEAWLKGRGTSLAEVSGKTVFDFFPKEIAERLAAQDVAVLKSGEALPEVEQKIVMKGAEPGRGEVRWLATTKVPLRDASGRVIGTVGVSRDITEQQRSVRRRSMEHAVTRTLAESETLEHATPRLLATMCEALEWGYGAFWSWSEAEGTLVRRAFWSERPLELDPEEEMIWTRVTSVEAAGLLRRALAEKAATWIEDLEREGSLKRRESALRLGFRSAFSFPVLAASELIGVMEFFGREPRRPDPGLLQVAGALGSQIGQFVQRKRAEEALRASEEQFRQLAANIPQVFWIADLAQRQTLYVSPAAERVLGLRPEQILKNARSLVRVIHPDDRARVYRARRAAAEGSYDETYRVVRPDGSVRWIHDRAFPVRDASGTVQRIAGIAEDITERRQAEERLLQLAHYDVLTSLPNRVLFYDRLKQALAQARRNRWIVGIMFLDIDRFKNVNDTLGHAVGDRLLQQASERLTRAVRTGDTVGRLGGDEFAVVLSNLSGVHDAALIAQKLMAAFNEPFVLEGAEIFVTVSIGVTLYPNDSTDQDTLIRNADAAMYRAKERGRNGYQFYRPELNARSRELLGLESGLRRALERGEFVVHYQPRASVAGGEVTGLEALLRWRHPERGLVPPGDFIPLMEETGLIVPAGAWVLDAVCAQISEWRRAGLKPVPVAINLSARQFLARDLGAAVRGALERHRVEPQLLELEITESSLMVDIEEAGRTLEYLKSLGVGLAIDDFGTGYSSFGYLKRFPLDALKIDRSFVRDITTDPDSATITRAVIGMGHSLGLKLIAEGVETAAQLAFLSEYGCDEVQGFYLARPMAAEECGGWLRRGRRLAAPRPDGAGALVLLVDDDEDALVLMKRALAKDGHRVLTARSAREALDVLGAAPVDVVISDQSMPETAGVEFLQRVKALSPHTVRLMSSGYRDFASLAEAVNKGQIFRFVAKEDGEEELCAAVREALRARAERGDGAAPRRD